MPKSTKPKAAVERKQAPEKKPPGRPSSFCQKIADELCERISHSTKSLRKICEDEDMPHRGTVFRWLADEDNKQFRDQYARAKELQAELMGEEILEISDDGTNDTYIDNEGNTHTNHDVIARSRLRVDSRKWLLSKMLPKKYGDKLAIGGDADAPPIQTNGTLTLTPDEAYKLLLNGNA